MNSSEPPTIVNVRDLTGQISDGFHTFDELYDHRITLYLALCRRLDKHRAAFIWRSRFHSDGTSFQGWFVLGIGSEPGKQITYHLPESRWAEADFATELDRAPDYDGHSGADVLERLKRL